MSEHDPREGPISLGKLTKLLGSANKSQVKRGLKLLHKRFHHKGTEVLERLCNRAGLDISKHLIDEVVKACRACRMWMLPKPVPKTRISRPAGANEEVEADLMFFDTIIIFHMIDRGE